MAGYTNVDFYDEHADMKRDLFKFPWPWKNESADEIVMYAFLEHFDRPMDALHEVVRILKPGGLLRLILPHAYAPSHHHFDHKCAFTSWTLRALSEPIGPWIWETGKPPFAQTYLRIRWITVPGVTRWTPLDCLLSKWPGFFEKFIPIRPSEIEWEGRKLK